MNNNNQNDSHDIPDQIIDLESEIVIAAAEWRDRYREINPHAFFDPFDCTLGNLEESLILLLDRRNELHQKLESESTEDS